MPVILKDIRKKFGERSVFAGLTHTFPVGITLLTGPSGCGKTTLLRMIAGLEKPDSGRIQTDGISSFLFQESRLFPWYTAEKNVSLVSDTDTASKLLRELELADAAALYPDELSGGMQRRVAIARALAYRADIYLFDEPANGLNQPLKHLTAELIRRYTEGKTVIIVSHETDYLESIVDYRFALS